MPFARRGVACLLCWTLLTQTGLARAAEPADRAEPARANTSEAAPEAGQAPARPQEQSSESAQAPQASSAGTSGDDGLPVLPLVILGAGLVVTGVGAYLATRIEDAKRDMEGHCIYFRDERRCDDYGLAANDRARDFEVASWLTIGAGVSALAVGAVLILSSHGRTKVRASPVVSPAMAGISVVSNW